MVYTFWSIAAWVPLGIGLLALVTLVIMFTWDFTRWYIKQNRNSTQESRHKMFKPRTIIHIHVEDARGIYHHQSCDSVAAAVYYLAYLAAGYRLPLLMIAPNHVYQIGDLSYVLEDQQLLTTRAVGRLRKALEGQTEETKTRAA